MHHITVRVVCTWHAKQIIDLLSKPGALVRTVGNLQKAHQQNLPKVAPCVVFVHALVAPHAQTWLYALQDACTAWIGAMRCRQRMRNETAQVWQQRK